MEYFNGFHFSSPFHTHSLLLIIYYSVINYQYITQVSCFCEHKCLNLVAWTLNWLASLYKVCVMLMSPCINRVGNLQGVRGMLKMTLTDDIVWSVATSYFFLLARALLSTVSSILWMCPNTCSSYINA